MTSVGLRGPGVGTSCSTPPEGTLVISPTFPSINASHLRRGELKLADRSPRENLIHTHTEAPLISPRKERNGGRGGMRDCVPHQARLRGQHDQGKRDRQAGTGTRFPIPSLLFLCYFLGIWGVLGYPRFVVAPTQYYKILA